MGFSFLASQSIATISAMTINFIINNSVTYRDQRLRGWMLPRGYILFCLVCSVGALANIGVANLAIQESTSWSVAGIAGAVMGAVFNFGAATKLVWGRKRRSG
jgi:dolichol-phosphate mannosyltransferase